ncbi:thiol reductant ABC exporter subunit CydC [Homoserinibacter sp. YIM 151385]|uniref:thiol reductant ABC exporter subunit CydC n=1 Tax=Homoserinibacter sp. YIM 151385 TaxID=2985506 RepID=UPI0022F0051F|nr:thiol reductant ABC exporter subunit CydC [Homoserinibacter sp. YIM 151385]WBU38703.1 thiol reductant ABC exporter subunit CydC [Homoserinibacter sp. YIM 151385]
MRRGGIPLGPTARRTVAGTAVVSLLRAVAIVAFADALARLVVGAVEGRLDENALAWAAGALVARALGEWLVRVVAARGALELAGELRLGVVRAAIARGDDAAATALLAGRRVDEVRELFSGVLPALTATAVVPLVVGLRILSLDLVSAVVVALTLPLVPIFMILVGRHTQDRVDRASGALDRLAEHLVELARGLPVLVGLGRLEDQIRALDGVGRAHRRATMGALRTAFLSALVLELIATISVAVVAVFIGVRLVAGELPLEVGLLVLILAPECYTPLREVGAAFHASRAGQGALRDAEAAIARPRAAGVVRRGRPSGLRVRDLVVRYEGRARPALALERLDARQGELLAIAAPSGGGKSTLLAAILDRLPASAEARGRVERPERLAWAPQSPTFSRDRVDAELRLHGGPGEELADAELEAVLRSAALGRLALDADPALLSPGERRRLAIARVLLRVRRGAALVVLDEPTAHLDDEAAEAVIDELWLLRGTATVVVATHDPRLLALADRVVRLPEPARADGLADAAADATQPDAAAPRTAAAIEPTAPEVARPASIATETAARPLGLRDILRPVRWRLALGMLLAAGSSAAAAALTALSGWLIVTAAEQPPILTLMVAIVGVRFFGIARSALRYAERLAVHDAVLRLAERLRLRLWRVLAAAGPAHRRLLRGGTVVGSLVVAPDEVRDLAPRVLVPPAAALMTVAGGIAAIAILAPAALLAPAIVLAATLLAAPAAALLADRRAAAGELAASRRSAGEVVELLAAAAELGAHDVLDAPLAELAARDARRTALARRAALARGLAAGIATAGALLASLVLAAALPPLVAAGALAPAGMAALVLLPLGLVEPILLAADAVRSRPALREAVSRLLRPAPAADVSASGLPDRAGDAALALEEVDARWPGARPVLEELSLRLEPGEGLLVQGPSGSGKSTLLAVLLGHLAPERGRIAVAGRAPAEAARDRRVAWTPQESLVFAASLRANLRLARPSGAEPSDAELEAALEAVGLAPLLAAMPEGLDTPVGRGGAALSGGERQRLAVARALLSRAEVLLLDEPTAHLDEPTAEALRRDLPAAVGGRTLVVVSHLAADAALADHVVELGRDPQGLDGDSTAPRNTMFTSERPA